jgi:flagellar biosynthesis/type III secretory pathway protein FliH
MLAERVGVFSFEDVERKAAALLADARARAAAILAEAERRATEEGQRLRRAAHAEGLAEGRATGMREVRAESWQAALEETRARLTSLAAALESALAELDQNQRRLLAQAESGLIRLAVEIARRVCKVRVDAGGEAAAANARALLEIVRGAGDIEVCLHPDDLAALRDVAGDSATRIADLEHVRLAPDESLGRGDCRLLTRDGRIDASVSVQLDRIAAAICGPAPGEKP